jgi:predicted SprT family Zn-dependent metalloprotease
VEHDPTIHIISSLQKSAATWSTLWGVSGLEHNCRISFSNRLRRSLGRCYPRRRSITLAAHLKNESFHLIEEVLCHELAHLAVFESHEETCRPHGPEWAKLVHAAGFEPRTRFHRETHNNPHPVQRRRHIYSHRCPVCQSKWAARRSMHNWRCSACIRLGFDGRLEIQHTSGQQGETP